MRLIHTADIHLDASFAATGMPPAFGNRRRQRLREVLVRILHRARDWPADAVLIAGDLFEHERVTRDTVAFLLDAFRELAPIPVFIAPGNRDPYLPSSPYASELWPEQVHIFRTPNWEAHALEHLPLTVHGFAFDGAEVSSNPFGTLEVPADGRIHVALGHGAERGHQPPGKPACAPFDAAQAAAPGLHYLALGHCHEYCRIETPDTLMAYCGAPEGHGFEEAGSRHYLEIEIRQEDTGVHAELTPVSAAHTVYTTYTLDLTGFSEINAVVEAVRGLAQALDVPQIARVRLEGACAAELASQMHSIHEAAADAFESLQLLPDVQPQEDYDVLARHQTSLGAFIQRLNEDIAAAPDPARVAILTRAREIGLAAYRNQATPLRGVNGNPR